MEMNENAEQATAVAVHGQEKNRPVTAILHMNIDSDTVPRAMTMGLLSLYTRETYLNEQ